MKFPEKFENLVKSLSCFSGVGTRTATRMALHLFKYPHLAEELSNSIEDASVNIKKCPDCGNMTEIGLCNICANAKRDDRLICVVETVDDLITVENSGCFYGKYIVLGGHLSPLEGIGTETLFVKPLIEKLNKHLVDEVVIATNPDTNGENTALYIKELSKPYAVRITRIAYGIPFGVSLIFVDKTTIGRALEGRVRF